MGFVLSHSHGLQGPHLGSQSGVPYLFEIKSQQIYRSGWSQTQDPLVSATQVLGLEVPASRTQVLSSFVDSHDPLSLGPLKSRSPVLSSRGQDTSYNLPDLSYTPSFGVSPVLVLVPPSPALPGPTGMPSCTSSQPRWIVFVAVPSLTEHLQLACECSIYHLLALSLVFAVVHWGLDPRAIFY